MFTTARAFDPRSTTPSVRTNVKSSGLITYGPRDPFETATWMVAYSCNACGITANITVTPDRVRVWYLSPLDSNSITWACAHRAHSRSANPYTASQRAIDP